MPSVEDAYSMTTVVVSGKIISLNYVSLWATMAPEKRAQAKEDFLKTQPNTKSLETPIIQKVALEVSKTYKGENIIDTLIIFTPRNGASCGFAWFKVGGSFIIYASPRSFYYGVFPFINIEGMEQKNTYWTNHCTRTNYYYEKEAQELTKLSQK
ncbi:MAG: hypothetical protein JKY03_05710 [Aureispira sp.]|nr:hypothetical protein [Aureispira sp.]